MDHSAEFRRRLAACDIAGVRELWAHVSPHTPAPAKDEHVLVAIHNARTQMQTIAFRLRAYSHSWLVERGWPSALPDELKPRAERLYPRVVGAVGIAVRPFKHSAEHAQGLHDAMADAVMDSYAEGHEEPTFVKARMAEARDKFLRTA